MPISPNVSPFTSIDQIKVGMPVLVVSECGGCTPEMVGRIFTVRKLAGDGAYLHGTENERSMIFDYGKLAPVSSVSAASVKLSAARAEVARLEAEEAAAKALDALPNPARKCYEYLDANPSAFGCQRAHVLAIVEALTGCKLPS